MCSNKSNVLAGTKDSDEKMQQKIELQLHEQYAINNNANLGSVITFMISIITVVGFYAYTFAHTNLHFSDPALDNMCDEGMYTLDCLIFLAAGVICVLTIIQYICLYQGSQQRYEQFIIYAIRCKYFGSNFLSSQNPRMFPEGYHPFNKDLNSFVQGLYGEFIRIAEALKLIVVLTSILKVSLNVYKYHSSNISVFGLLCCIAFLIAICSTCCWLKSKFRKRFLKYVFLCCKFIDCYDGTIQQLLESTKAKNSKIPICPMCNLIMKVFHCKHRCPLRIITRKKHRQ